MPRARGGRGRGRAVTSPIAVTPVAGGSNPQAALEARKAGLVEKAQELEDVDRKQVAVAMICSGIDGLGGVSYWPSMCEARAVVGMVFELPEEKRITEDHANYVTRLRDAQRSKLAEVREGGIAAALGPWERDLDGKPVEALQELLASIEVSRKAARSRIRERQPQPDESMAGEEDASGEVQGTQKQPQGADEVQGPQNQPPGDDDDEDDAAWPEEALQELLNSIEASQNAAGSRIRERQPQPDESVAENLVEGEENASGEVQGTQQQPPQGADEVQGTQNQPPVEYDDGEDDAAWMEQLVEDLKEKPESASGSAAPYRAAPHEYINEDGFVMERDAYHYMQYDLTMFTPYYGLPLRLWPWGDSSFPWGAPPPPR